MSSASDFIIENGVLKKYVGPGGDVTVPNGVTSIGNGAFSGCSSLTRIALPDSVTSIGGKAFNGCGSLTSVTIPDGVMNIEYATFAGCWSLKSITLPMRVTSIEDYAFAGCCDLKSITLPDSVTSVGSGAFERCKGLKELRLPEAMEILSGGAFADCAALESVIFSKSLTIIEGGAFEGCEMLRSVVLPANLEEIGHQCFDRCSALEKVTLPDSLKTIAGGAFARCPALRQIDCSDQGFRLFLDSCNAKNLLTATYNYLTGNLITSAKPDEIFGKYVKKNTAKLFPMILENDNAAALDAIAAIGGTIDQKVLDSMLETAIAAQNAPSVTAWLLRYKEQNTDPVKAALEENIKLDKALGLRKMTVADWKEVYAIKSIDAERVQLGKFSTV